MSIKPDLVLTEDEGTGYDYSDISLYESWEQYYTNLLIATGKKYNKAYSKKKMVSYYYENADKVFRLFTDLDLSSLECKYGKVGILMVLTL